MPESNFRRELSPGRSVPITRAQYDDLMFDPGFTVLVQNHYISINGITDQKKVELTSPVYDTTAIGKLLDNGDITAFAKFINTAEQAEKETVVQMAIDKGITHPGITALIKQKCGVDVIKAINMKHLAEED